MKNITDWKMKTKIFLLMGVTVFVLVTTLLVYQTWNTVKTSRNDIENFQIEEIAKHKQNLIDFVDIAYETIESSYKNSQNKSYLESQYGYRLRNIIDVAESIMNLYIEKVERGEMTLENAQLLVIEEIKAMRYDNGTGYIWINDTQSPYPVMIMHPTVPSLDGTVLDDPKYDCAMGINQNLFQAFVDVTLQDGEGFVDYVWPKPTESGLTEDQPKLSFVRLFEPWQWIIGTGIYIDDAVEDAKTESLRVIEQMRYSKGVGYFWVNDTQQPYPAMIMHPTVPELNGTILDAPKYNCAMGIDQNLFQAFVDVTSQDGEGFVDYVWPKPTESGLTEDQPKLSFVRKFEPWQWIIGTGVYVDDINSSIDEKHQILTKNTLQSIGISVLIALILVAIAAISFSIILRAIINPISKTVIWSKKLAEGDLADNLDYVNGDEIGIQNRNINKAVDSIRELVENIKKSSRHNTEISRHLISGTDETITSITEISTNTDSIKSRITELDNNILNSSSAIEEILTNITFLNTQIEDQSAAVTETTASVEEMLASLRNVANITKIKKNATDKLVETARAGSSKLSNTSSIIHNIIGNVDSIMEMISIINNVASQTNLLSMNAAIEAAHAGDSGKGFAVVADEIRKLAESSSKNSKNISAVLKDVIANINNAASASEETGKSFEQVDKEVSEVAMAFSEISSTTGELLAGSDQILKAMESLRDISIVVKDGSGKMKNGADEAAVSQENIKDISTSVLKRMDEIVAGTKHIKEAINKVSDFSHEMGESSEKINKELNKFRTSKN